MLGRSTLGWVVVTAAFGCGSTAKNGGSSSGSNDSGSVGGDGGTGTVTSDASASSSAGSGTSADSGSGGSPTTNGSSATSAETTGSSTDTTSNVTTGMGGSGGSTVTSTEGAGGSGGAAPGCPDAPPSAGSECESSGQVCGYEDCGGVGRTVAHCLDTWVVETAACDDTVTCQGFGAADPCGYGQVCVVLLSGIAQQLCVDNTCGDGPVSCDCIEGCYGVCGVVGDAAIGITISCNACPSQDGCA